MPKKGGPNQKAVAAKEKKDAHAAEVAAKKRQEEEAAEAASWNEGAFFLAHLVSSDSYSHLT